MATMPPAQPNPAAMGGAAPEAGAQPPEAGGYCIELYVRPDGTFTVKKEMKEEAPEMEEPGEGPAKTADNIGDALKLVLDVYEQDGNASADSEFDEGFGAKPAAMGAKPGMPADM